jgi:nucleotide-binding universal stress UspA family protein
VLAAAGGAEVVAVRVVAGSASTTATVGESTIVVSGAPARSILVAAEEVAADVIVVGRRGAGGYDELRLGSTAHQVAELADRPVAVVPNTVGPDPTGWPVSVIAVGHDGSSVAVAAVSWTVPLAVASASSVVLVHAVELAPAFAAAGLADDAYESARSRRVEVVESEWCAPLRAAGVAYETVVADGGPAVVLLDAVRTRGADLLVVGRQAHGSFPGMAMGSVAHRALGYAPCPTVVVPALF